MKRPAFLFLGSSLLVLLGVPRALAQAQAPAPAAAAPAVAPAPEPAPAAASEPESASAPESAPESESESESKTDSAAGAASAVAADSTAASAELAATAESVELPAPEVRPIQGLGAAGDPFGEAGGESFGMFSIRVLLQTRYTATWAAPSDNTRASYRVREDWLAEHDDGFAINRLFVRLAAEPTPYVGFKALFDFAELIDDDPADMVKQAYATLRPLPEHFEIAAGVLKLPYSTLELDASANYELAEFGDADKLVKDLGFAGRDVGAEVMAAPLRKTKWLMLTAGVFAGHAHGEHDSPLGAVGARIESRPAKAWRIGADIVAHPETVTYLRPFETSGKDLLPNPPDPAYPREQQWEKGWAWSADVRYNKKRLMLRAEVMGGDRVDVFSRYGAEKFGVVWALAAYRFRIGPAELMPAMRVEFLDGDWEHAVGLRRELSAGITLLYPTHVRLLFDVTRSDVQAHSPLLDQPKPLSDPPYMALDFTRFITQLQVQI
jgi:hypothetical protein